MADVRAFRGVTYNPAHVDLSRVLCPPYDVVSPEQQVAYYDRDLRNAIRVVLNLGEGDERYRDASNNLDMWFADGSLLRARRPAFYVHRHTFDAPGVGRVSRSGFVAAVRLEPWSDGAVLPHEHTMPGPKLDRLALTRATNTDTEPIWVFQPDPSGAVRARIPEVIGRTPLLEATFTPVAGSDGDTPSPEEHALWVIDDEEEVGQLSRLLSAEQLYIADGHHRYETALVHAEEVGGGADDATRFKTMLITPLEDPGLLVLPTHRLLKLPPGRTLGGMLSQLRTWGWTSEQPVGLAELQARLALPAAYGRVGIGLFAERRFSYFEGLVASPEVESLPPSVRALDVAQVHEGILGPLLGLDREVADAGVLIAYSRDPGEVRARVASGEFDAGLFLRPPTLEQVQAVADSRSVMPHKSTYFWPKPPSGLLLALEEPGEDL